MVCEEGVKEPKKSHFQVSLSQIKKKNIKGKKSNLTKIPDEFQYFSIYPSCTHITLYPNGDESVLCWPMGSNTLEIERREWLEMHLRKRDEGA